MPKFSIKQYVCVGVFLLSSLCAAYVVQYYTGVGPLNSKKIIYIEKGTGLLAIAEYLHTQGAIDHPWLFQLHLRLRGLSHQLRAGEFELPADASPEDVFNVLAKGPFVQHAITIPEGLQTREIIELVSKEAGIVMQALEPIQEGELLPETYYYTKHEPIGELTARMKTSMKLTLSKAWATHKAGHTLKSEHEVLILASIVEKETGKAKERPHVAAVFLNRLKIGMPLQSDPTVIYGLSVEYQRHHVNLSRADLKIPSTYNTYLNQGLPPTPICNPGKASIEAVMQPLDSEDLYFVADGTGGHAFAKTYEEHMKNHQKWRSIRDDQ